MTDRVQGFTVVLDKDIREDDVEELRKAIAQMRHVAVVTNVITTSDSYFARMRLRTELATELGTLWRNFLHDKLNERKVE